VSLACPQCGAPIAFRSADLILRVCDYCRSAIVRDGETLRAAGKAAVVPDDVSPLRLGTRGRWQDQPFELIGRVRWRWSDGGWNEWLGLLADGRHFWLGEASGRFMLLEQLGRSSQGTGVVRAVQTRGTPEVGAEAAIDGVDYVVADVREAVCVASEGELPFVTTTGTKVLSVDLVANDGRCASVQREGNGKDAETHVYTGRFVSLAGIRATDLRAFEGWPMPRYA
jgi:hypothetical protein